MRIFSLSVIWIRLNQFCPFDTDTKKGSVACVTPSLQEEVVRLLKRVSHQTRIRPCITIDWMPGIRLGLMHLINLNIG